MTTNPRLSGGILLNLLSNAKKKRTSTSQVTETQILQGLINIVDASWKPCDPTSFKKYTSYYKNIDLKKGDYSYTYLPFNENEEDNIVVPFKKLMKDNYKIALNNTNYFVQAYLDELKIYPLTYALLEIIKIDTTITKNFIYNGIEYTKEKMIEEASVNELDFVSLLLGVWFYIVCYIQINSVGHKTLKEWQDDFGIEKNGMKKFKCPFWLDDIEKINIKLKGIEKVTNPIIPPKEITEHNADIDITSTFASRDFKTVFTKIKTESINDLGSKAEFYILDFYDGKFDMDSLQRMLYMNIGRYVYSRAKIDSFNRNGQASYVEGQAARIMKKLSEKDGSLMGDRLGSMLIYSFLEGSLNAPKLMSEAELKTDLAQYSSKCESIHLLTSNLGGNVSYQLVFGASQLSEDLNDAINKAFKDIMEINKNNKSERKMIDKAVFERFFDQDEIDILKNILLPQEGKQSLPDSSYGIFLGYNVNISPSPNFENEVKTKINKDIDAILPLIKKLIISNGLGTHSFYFYILPFNDVNNEKNEIMKNVIQGDVDL